MQIIILFSVDQVRNEGFCFLSENFIGMNE